MTTKPDPTFEAIMRLIDDTLTAHALGVHFDLGPWREVQDKLKDILEADREQQREWAIEEART